MDLILWRHAEAEDGSPDAARKLTPRGRRQAEKVADWLSEKLPGGTRVYSSPARRARQTAHALTRRFSILEAADTDGDAKALLAACGWPGAEGTVVLVGHQPILGRAAALALTGRTAELGVRKGALWWLRSRVRGSDRVSLIAAISPDVL